MCRVVVTVTQLDAPRTLQIYQDASDESKLLRLSVDADLNSLLVRGPGGRSWNNGGHSLHVHVAESASACSHYSR